MIKFCLFPRGCFCSLNDSYFINFIADSKLCSAKLLSNSNFIPLLEIISINSPIEISASSAASLEVKLPSEKSLIATSFFL